jgi:hypothetical protein
VHAYVDGNPMTVAGVRGYRVMEFEVHDCQPAVKEWFR